MKEDRRKKYTKLVLRNSLIELLNEKELSRISVTEICKRADVNRATYYAYYTDVYDQYKYLTSDFYSKVCTIIDATGNNEDNRDIILTLCKYIEENKELYIPLVGKSSIESQINLMNNEALKNLIKRITGATHYNAKDFQYVFTCFYVGTNALIYKWLTDKEYNITSEEIADLIYQMARYGSTGEN